MSRLQRFLLIAAALLFVDSGRVAASGEVGSVQERILQEIARTFGGVVWDADFRFYSGRLGERGEEVLIGVSSTREIGFDLYPSMLIQRDGRWQIVLCEVENGRLVEVFSLRTIEVGFSRKITEAEVATWQAQLRARIVTGVQFQIDESRHIVALRSLSPKQMIVAFASLVEAEAISFRIFPIGKEVYEFEALGGELPNSAWANLKVRGLPPYDPLLKMRTTSTAVEGQIVATNGKFKISMPFMEIPIRGGENLGSLTGIPLLLWLQPQFFGVPSDMMEVVEAQRIYNFNAVVMAEPNQIYFVSPEGVKFVVPNHHGIYDELQTGRVYSFRLLGGPLLAGQGSEATVESLTEVPELISTDGSPRIAVLGPIEGAKYLRVGVETARGLPIFEGDGKSQDGTHFAIELLPDPEYGRDDVPRRGVIVRNGDGHHIQIFDPKGVVEIDRTLGLNPDFLSALIVPSVCETVLIHAARGF